MAQAIKHWGRRYDAAQENICSAPGCMREAVEFDSHGQPKCSRDLVLRLEVAREARVAQLSDVRRLRHAR